MRGFVRDTFAEMRDQKIIWVLVALTLFSMLLAAASRSVDMKMKVNGAEVESVEQFGLARAALAVDYFMAFLVFIVVMASAAAVPNMLERGRADYFLAKPISRTYLFSAKFFSVWMIYGATVLTSSFLVYLMFAMVDGHLDPGILILLASGAVQVGIWLTVTFTAGVVTGSTALAIVAAFLLWMFQWILSGREAIKMFFMSDIASAIIDTLYYIMPKTSELSKVGLALTTGNPVGSWVPVWSSLGFGLLLVIISLFYINRKDY